MGIPFAFYLLAIALSFLPLLGVVWFIYFLLSLPLRRQERAAFLLDLIESGSQAGRSPETSIITFAQSRDRTMGWRFYLLAAYLETGLRLGQALDKVPYLLPPRIGGMLKTGQEIGDVKKVLPLCRRFLNDGVSKTQGAINYLVLLAFVFTPVFPAPMTVMRIYILPKWKDIFHSMSDGPLPALTQIVFDDNGWFVIIQYTMMLLLYVAAAFYIAGPRTSVWLKRNLSIAILDRLAFRIPWKRKRMQRDFSAMLAMLLDAEVPEARAIQLAAESTANEVFVERARKVVAELSQGKTLNEALQRFDGTGEFKWRLDNGAKGANGFSAALNGWLEALDAKAFQLEQSTAQLLTTGLVLLNGLMVGVIVIGLFGALVVLVDKAVLW